MLSRRQVRCCAGILRHILYRETAPLPAMDRAVMRRIFHLNGMESMVDCCEDPALAPLRAPEKAFGHMLYQRSIQHTVTFLFQEMNRRGIRAAVLKGVAVSECYPKDVVRTSGDIDLYVPGSQREAVSQMMREAGLSLASDLVNGQCGADTFVTSAGVCVEVHYIYFLRLSARQKKVLRRHGFFSADLFVPSAEGNYSVLRPEAHLFYLAYHAGKHMLAHTVTLRMLSDITMFVNRYADEIDGEAFRRLADELRYTRIFNALFCFCKKHLGMRKDFWRKSGCSMDFFVRLMFKSGEERSWERFIDRGPEAWIFYRGQCVEENGEFRSRYCYAPGKAFKRKYSFSTFVFWWLLRLIWGCEVDFSREAA